MERQYPPFGQIPGPIAAAPYLVRQTPQAALSLTAFQVLPSGVLVLLRTSTREPALVDARYSFEAMSADEPTQLQVWVESAPGEESRRVAANLVNGSRGQDEGVDARVFTLWFPVDLQANDGPLVLRLEWPEADIVHETVTLEPTDIRAALAIAYVP
ncbi:MAG TPA: hypothetical protein VJ851_09385 [Jatrophihabitans sp.]|nr:hypothetical protein [Jatrophihabitans sp.]